MIIKIRGNEVIPKEAPAKQCDIIASYKWWLYDNIVKMSHEFNQIVAGATDRYDVGILPNPTNEIGFSDYIVIIARDNRNKEFSIVTNSCLEFSNI